MMVLLSSFSSSSLFLQTMALGQMQKAGWSAHQLAAACRSWAADLQRLSAVSRTHSRPGVCLKLESVFSAPKSSVCVSQRAAAV
jgi:hypothetical protein